MAKAGRQYGVNKFYSDHRQSPTHVSMASSYELGHEKNLTLGFKPGSKSALVIQPTKAEIEHYKFTETVWANAGHQLKAFTDPEEALSWLNSDQ